MPRLLSHFSHGLIKDRNVGSLTVSVAIRIYVDN